MRAIESGSWWIRKALQTGVRCCTRSWTRLLATEAQDLAEYALIGGIVSMASVALLPRIAEPVVVLISNAAAAVAAA